MTNVEDCEISGVWLRGFLAGLRKVSGASYPRLLEKSGLSRFATKYPPLDLTIVANGREIILLQQEIITLLGLDIYQLFLKNLGRQTGKNTATYPPLIEAFQKARPFNTIEDLKRAVELYIKIVQTILTYECSLEINQAPKGILLAHHNCLLCAGLSITNIQRPFCSFSEVSIKEILQALANPRIKVEEVRCALMHPENKDSTCKYLITLPL